MIFIEHYRTMDKMLKKKKTIKWKRKTARDRALSSVFTRLEKSFLLGDSTERPLNVEN